MLQRVRKRSLRHNVVVLLAAFLIGAQMGTVAHAVRHSMHPHHDVCMLCHAANSFSNGPLAAAPVIPPRGNLIEPTPVPALAPRVAVACVFQARAPPLV